jgi:hypothetical protein
MIKSDHAGETPSSRGFARWLLLAFAGFLGLNVGAGLLASVVIFPVWSASPEAAAAWQRAVDEARFFIVVSPLVLVLAVASLVASWWVDRDVRLWMRTAAVLYLVFFAATMVYFVPGQAALQGDTAAFLPAQELSASLQRWITLNWVRQVVGLLAFGSALHALGLSYTVRHAQSAVAQSPHEVIVKT